MSDDPDRAPEPGLKAGPGELGKVEARRVRAVDEVGDPVDGDDTVRQLSDVGGQAPPNPPFESRYCSVSGSTKEHAFTRSDRST